MSNKSSLRLYEKAMLLILKDREGTVGVSMYTYGLAGTLLAELFLEERLVASGKNSIVAVSDRSPVGDPLLDECLQLIGDSAKPRTAQHWVSTISGLKDLKDRIAQQLCRRGILCEDEDKVLFFFTRKIYPQVDPRPEQELIQELRNAIFSDAGEVSGHTAALVAVGNSTGLLEANFSRRELKDRKQRIKEIANGDVSGPATAAVVGAVQTAIFVCCIMPAIIT